MMNDRPPPPDEPDPIVPRDLKAKRTVPSPRKAATIRSAKGSIFGKASIPSVYWAGDDPTPMNNEEFTFYREDTPPLPDGTGGDKAARTRGYRQSVFDHDEEDSDRKRKRKCCGMTMWVFWLLVALIVAVVLGVGIGVGVGIGANQKSDQSAATTRYVLLLLLNFHMRVDLSINKALLKLNFNAHANYWCKLDINNNDRAHNVQLLHATEWQRRNCNRDSINIDSNLGDKHVYISAISNSNFERQCNLPRRGQHGL